MYTAIPLHSFSPCLIRLIDAKYHQEQEWGEKWITGAPKTFGDAFEGRSNNFNLIRMVAALMVLFSHYYPLVELHDWEPFAYYLGG